MGGPTLNVVGAMRRTALSPKFATHTAPTAPRVAHGMCPLAMRLIPGLTWTADALGVDVPPSVRSALRFELQPRRARATPRLVTRQRRGRDMAGTYGAPSGRRSPNNYDF